MSIRVRCFCHDCLAADPAGRLVTFREREQHERDAGRVARNGMYTRFRLPGVTCVLIFMHHAGRLELLCSCPSCTAADPVGKWQRVSFFRQHMAAARRAGKPSSLSTVISSIISSPATFALVATLPATRDGSSSAGTAAGVTGTHFMRWVLVRARAHAASRPRRRRRHGGGRGRRCVNCEFCGFHVVMI